MWSLEVGVNDLKSHTVTYLNRPFTSDIVSGDHIRKPTGVENGDRDSSMDPSLLFRREEKIGSLPRTLKQGPRRD